MRWARKPTPKPTPNPAQNPCPPSVCGPTCAEPAPCDFHADMWAMLQGFDKVPAVIDAASRAVLSGQACRHIASGLPDTRLVSACLFHPGEGLLCGRCVLAHALNDPDPVCVQCQATPTAVRMLVLKNVRHTVESADDMAGFDGYVSFLVPLCTDHNSLVTTQEVT